MTRPPAAHDLARLLRLRQLREQAAQRALADAQRERDAVLATMREREAEIERLRTRREALTAQLSGPHAGHVGRVVPYAAATREDLTDLLERAEYALIDDEDELDSAETRVAEARQAWQRAQAHRHAAETLVADARKARLREAEQRLEREDPAVRPQELSR